MRQGGQAQAVICRALQRLFLERPAVAHLVHQQVRVLAMPRHGRCSAPSMLHCKAPGQLSRRMQGYALSLVPVVAAHVPAARLVVPGLADRVAAAEPGDALFAVTLACHLACQHPCPATHVSARQSAPGMCGTRLAPANQGCCGAGGRARRAGAHARGCGGRQRALCEPGAGRARRCRGRQPPAQRGRGCAVPGALSGAILA